MPWELQLLLTVHHASRTLPSPLSESALPSPQAHLIICCLGKDLELALCGEQGAIIGASLKGWRAGGMVSPRAPPWTQLSLLVA